MQGVARRQTRCCHLACHNLTRVSWQLCRNRPVFIRPAGALLPYSGPLIRYATTQALHGSRSPNTAANLSFTPWLHDEESILVRAGVHGIETWEQLAFEADLTRRRSPSKKLVHDDSVRQDLDLWSVLLDFRHSKDGQRGISDVLRSMLHDGEPVRLYADSVSGHIWRTVLPVILNDEELLFELCHSGTSFLDNRPFVFGDAVGYLLANNNIRLAIIVATQLLRSHFRGHSDLIHLFDIAVQNDHPHALQNYCRIISRLPLHKVYGDVIAKIWTAQRPRDAFIVHDYLLSRGDLPTQFEQIEPFVRQLASIGAEVEPFLERMELQGIAFSHQARQLYDSEKAQRAFQSNKSVSYLLRQGPGSRPMKLSDAFVARTFATKSVSFDFVLDGLRFIGLFEIGPLAVREIALTAENITVLKRRFQKLESMKVDLGASNYVRVIRNLCMSDQDDLLQAILKSDMHHEVFEDVQKQKRLLAEYYQAKKWSEVNRTLAILHGGETGRIADIHTGGSLLQTCLILGDWRGTLETLDNLKQLTDGAISQSRLAPLRQALNRIWADSTVEARQDKSFLDRYRYLVGFMQLAHMAGMQAYPWQWRSVIHAVGRSGDWDLFQSLIISVARAFHEHLPSDQEVQNLSERGQVETIDNVFDADMQATIIELAVVTDGSGNNAKEAWLRGVKLLSRLQSCFGLHVDYSAVADALEHRFGVLFNDPDPGARKRLAVTYLQQFDWAWKECALYKEQEMRGSPSMRESVEPDLASLRLFRLRSDLVRLRRGPLDPGSISNVVDLNHQEDLDGGFHERKALEANNESDKTIVSQDKALQQAKKPENTGIVFYEDLLHPSYTGPKKVPN